MRLRWDLSYLPAPDTAGWPPIPVPIWCQILSNQDTCEYVENLPSFELTVVFVLDSHVTATRSISAHSITICARA